MPRPSNKNSRAAKAAALVKELGSKDAPSVDCACSDCVTKRRAFQVKLLGFLAQLMGEGNLGE